MDRLNKYLAATFLSVAMLFAGAAQARRRIKGPGSNYSPRRAQ